MRSSNIELLRIVAMLAIVAHHYVVNSTVTSLFDPLHPSANQIFLQLWGMWGKTAINVFVLITGFFMCESRLTAKRYCKVLFEIIFYSWIVWFVLSALGYETITWKGVVNRLILRVGVLIAMFSLCGTFLFANVYHHVFWYCTVYFAGAAIRKYPSEWMGSIRICVGLLVLSIVMAWTSVIGIDYLAVMLGRTPVTPHFFVSDSNKILAFLVACFAFLTFKNVRLPQSQFINAVASTTFGVFLIHAATDGMRKWLWQDLVNVPSAYSMPLPSLIGYSVVVMLGVFVVCSALDYLRICIVGSAVLRLSQMADFMVTRGVAWHNCAKLLGRVCWLMR